ncbi:helix-turn-helix domain-containing protein [Streptacidiphilus sp. PB12-B1b]|uniref:helix-turn-helix transcriptional regulator n=1 Tax=Streptacidiphilus sp. PB12-B1b TaxID=2705012 RepID=UPI0015FD5A03|nr:helix-turn-helix transcriptional regulator [Streptacidiphilus sp. PB12-B1b]QMU78303.1 helix-turn-helix domain-containing protein [Streptacidiphilus sp. PB12-B1b]
MASTPAQQEPERALGRTRREELRGFLRSRRARLKPEDVGLASGGWRRTPGLRREEVAVLAGIGVSWYTWLEQGRDIQVSSEVLEGVSRALRLNEPERAHIYRLAGLNTPTPRHEAEEALKARLRRVVDGWMPCPAQLVNRHGDVWAFNDSARAVFGLDEPGSNLVSRFFLDAAWRNRFPDTETEAREAMGFFRTQAARYPHDPFFKETARELIALSPLFRLMWERHEMSLAPTGRTVFTHPELGSLAFEHTTFDLTELSESRLHLYLPDATSGTAEDFAALVGRLSLDARAQV